MISKVRHQLCIHKALKEKEAQGPVFALPQEVQSLWQCLITSFTSSQPRLHNEGDVTNRQFYLKTHSVSLVRRCNSYLLIEEGRGDPSHGL